MAKSIRLIKSLTRLFLPVVVLFVVAVGGASVCSYTRPHIR
jgi:hypothetical protein